MPIGTKSLKAAGSSNVDVDRADGRANRAGAHALLRASEGGGVRRVARLYRASLLNDFVDAGDSLTSAREHRRLMQKGIVVDLLDQEIRHVSARDETACPVARIDDRARGFRHCRAGTD